MLTVTIIRNKWTHLIKKFIRERSAWYSLYCAINSCLCLKLKIRILIENIYCHIYVYIHRFTLHQIPEKLHFAELGF